MPGKIKASKKNLWGKFCGFGGLEFWIQIADTYEYNDREPILSDHMVFLSTLAQKCKKTANHIQNFFLIREKNGVILAGFLIK